MDDSHCDKPNEAIANRDTLRKRREFWLDRIEFYDAEARQSGGRNEPTDPALDPRVEAVARLERVERELAEVEAALEARERLRAARGTDGGTDPTKPQHT